MRTLGFSLVLATLLLAAGCATVGAPPLSAGDVVINRGAHHAWSNRSTRPARVAIAAHDGAY